MSEADKRQEGGTHYKNRPIQMWNLIIPMGWSAFQFEIINYVDRYQRKGGIEDLKKARHWLDKLIEVEEAKLTGTRELGEGFSISPVPGPSDSTKFYCKDCGKEFHPEPLCLCAEVQPTSQPLSAPKRERPAPPQYNGLKAEEG